MKYFLICQSHHIILLEFDLDYKYVLLSEFANMDNNFHCKLTFFSLNKQAISYIYKNNLYYYNILLTRLIKNTNIHSNLANYRNL